MNPVTWWPLLLAYLIGSVSVGVLASRGLGRDVRDRDFSGASGMIRQFGWRVGLAVAVADVLKGALAAILVRVLAPDLAWWAPLAVVVGHNWPVFFGFRGGQGLLPAFGGVLGVSPAVALPCLAVGFAALGVHRALGLKARVRLAGQPFGALFALPLALVLAWRLEGVVWPIVALLAAMLLRGVQVLASPVPGSESPNP